MRINQIDDARYKEFCRFLKHQIGITLGGNKQYLVNSRLSRAMFEFDLKDINQFVDKVLSNSNKEMTSRALECMTTNETLWFRDEFPFKILSDELLPALAKKQNKVRIWSAACSTGQEPYSLAMLLLDYQQRHMGAFSAGLEVFATDISQKAIDTAKKGIYDPLAVARGLPSSMRHKYFNKQDDDSFQVNQTLAQAVSFRQANLKDSYSAFGRFDVIFCRNVLIYFDDETKASILQKFSALLPQNGALVLGASESITGAERFYTMQKSPLGLYFTASDQLSQRTTR